MAPPPPAESESPANNKPHVAIFPYMAQGHTIPVIDFSKTLSNRGIRVTIITTPSNAPSILSRLSGDTHRRNITLVELPFSFRGYENTSELPSLDHHPDFILEAELQLRRPFEAFLRHSRDSNDLPRFVVSDFFLGFTLSVCTAFDVPRLVFHGMGVLSMSVCKACWIHKVDSDTIDLPGLKLPYTLAASDLPSEVVNSSDKVNPLTVILGEVGEADLNSWGVLVNSFVELEAGSVQFFESLYPNGARAWCVGPLCLYNDDDDESRPSDDNDDDDDRVKRWLDERRVGSVLYVSFGSQSDVSDAQLDEVACGLVESRENFVWVVRSRTWTVPNDIKDKFNDKGLVVSGWVDQRKILGHASVGGFLSHCGWNSILESLSAGIPVLAWPMFAEQGLNAKLAVEGLGAGIRVLKKSNTDGLVSKAAISHGVKELMSGEKGSAARERAQALGCAAKRAVGAGGSSRGTLDELIHKLCGI